MPDERLAELLRQRALLSRHVAWLDAEIARASGAAPDTEAPVVAKTTPVSTAPQSAPEPVVDASLKPLGPLPAVNDAATAEPEPVSEAVALANKRADEIIANYSTVDKFDPESARRGCILLAAAVFLIGTAILIGIYLLNYR